MKLTIIKNGLLWQSCNWEKSTCPKGIRKYPAFLVSTNSYHLVLELARRTKKYNMNTDIFFKKPVSIELLSFVLNVCNKQYGKPAPSVKKAENIIKLIKAFESPYEEL